jgi:formiminoglutamate deiminase
MSVYWCEMAWLGGEGPTPQVAISCAADGTIAAVHANVPAPDGAVVLPGLTLPGFANAHSHAFQRALRGRTEQPTGGWFWSWREQMYAVAAQLDPERSLALARATFAEMALAGITLVGEFDYIHHSAAIVQAAAEAGIRLTLIDACYLQGGLERFHDADVRAWAKRVDAIKLGPHARLGAAIHSVRAVDPVSAAVVAEFAAERDIPLHAHVSEQPAENEECERLHGATPLGVLYGASALSDRFTAVHATHFTPQDADLLTETGGYTCLCPTTERDLADGIGRPYRRLTLGSDSQSVIDMFEEARAVELDERLRSGTRGNWGAPALADAATAGGYMSLGWPEGGRIGTGELADLVAVRLDGVRLAGTRPADALDAVVFAAGAGDVDTVIVGGRQIVRAGEHLTVDVPSELAAAVAAIE